MNGDNREKLMSLYEGCKVYYGELHDHSDSGGTSDGKCTLAGWTEQMKELEMDFAAILDHRQIRHMYLPEWKDGLFIPGSEPGTMISDSKATEKHMHYNMLFGDRDELAKLLDEFPEFEFTGGIEGHFKYPSFTTERFRQLIDAVKAHGGFFVYPHPMQIMQSDDVCDYWFRDATGIEVFYISTDSEETKANYPLWTGLLAAGKRVFACAGGDLHTEPHDMALTTIYAEEHTSAAFMKHLRVGDFTCGAVGIRMCMGDTKTGGVCSFKGQKLKVAVGDFHKSVKFADHEYRLDILDDKGVVLSQPISCEETTFAEIEAKDAAFYRAEVFDVTKGLRIAVGNPIWNEDKR